MYNLLFFAAFATVLFLAVILAVLAASYQKLLEKYSFINERKNTFKNADKKIKKLLAESEDAAEKFKRDFERELIDISSLEMGTFRRGLSEVRINYLKKYNDLAIEFAASLRGEFSEIKKTLETKTVASIEEVKAGIAKKFQVADAEIEEYKTASEARIDTQINQVIKQVAQNCLGEIIDLGRHEELVSKSLEDAKKQNIL